MENLTRQSPKFFIDYCGLYYIIRKDSNHQKHQTELSIKKRFILLTIATGTKEIEPDPNYYGPFDTTLHSDEFVKRVRELLQKIHNTPLVSMTIVNTVPHGYIVNDPEVIGFAVVPEDCPA